MAALYTTYGRQKELNPDEDFVLHGRTTAYWEKKGYLTNSEMTGTTASLSQHSLYNPNNYKERKYARSMTDLAHNLDVLKDEVDQTLTRGVTLKDEQLEAQIQKEIEFQRALREDIKASQFATPTQNETLRSELNEDELLEMYEKRISEMDGLSGQPTSPRESQWFVNPNHIKGTSEAPTLQSIGKTYRNGTKSQDKYSDKDRVAFDYFPTTLGKAYEMCALDYPASEPLNATAPPSMRLSRSKSANRLKKTCTFRLPDRSFRDDQRLEKLYLMTKEAPTIGSSSVYLSSPHQLILGKLRLERLKLEEAKLLEAKRLEELERTRGPRPKWYMSCGPDFHYESNKNTNMIRSLSTYQQMLDYREDLLRSSYDNLKKYTRKPVAV